MSDLYTLEKMYEVNIVVYEMVEMEGEDEENDDKKDENHESEGTVTNNSQPAVIVRLVQHSLGKYKETMYLNKCGNHVSYITDISRYIIPLQEV